MLLATWNVNSIRSRIDQVKEWLLSNEIDVLCLQETKTEDKSFPVQDFSSIGYEVSISGQKSYNGVAIISRYPISDVKIGFDQVILNDFEVSKLSTQKRLISALINDIRIINVYVPNGSSLDSEKFIYKQEWLNCLKIYLAKYFSIDKRICLLGDFNIAPEDRDIYNPEKYTEAIMSSSKERKLLQKALRGNLDDVFRIFEPEKDHWTWWNYRHSSWEKNNGWRIDHIYLTEDLLRFTKSCWIDKTLRANEKPSDHVPVIVDICWPPQEDENELIFDKI